MARHQASTCGMVSGHSVAGNLCDRARNQAKHCTHCTQMRCNSALYNGFVFLAWLAQFMGAEKTTFTSYLDAAGNAMLVWYQIGSFCTINVGSELQCLRNSSLSCKIMFALLTRLAKKSVERLAPPPLPFALEVSICHS